MAAFHLKRTDALAIADGQNDLGKRRTWHRQSLLLPSCHKHQMGVIFVLQSKQVNGE